MRFVIDDFIRIANLLAGNAQGLREGRTGNLSGPPRALDGVGGRVFTHRIEHIFEYALIRMRLKVLL